MMSANNTEINSLTIASVLTVIFAIYPYETTLTKRSKILFILLPFIVNIAFGTGVIWDCYFERDVTKSISDFIHESDAVSFILRIVTASFIAMIVLFLFICFTKRYKYNDKQLRRYYLKLTESQKPSGRITIIGGSMDFLGKCPCGELPQNTFNCNKAYRWANKLKKISERWVGEKHCRECCLNNEQWRQLSILISGGCSLQILCTYPSKTPSESNTKKLLGFIIKAWNTNNNVGIKFFIDNDPHIRGRIIEDFSDVRHVCWNFKNTNGRQNSYEAPRTFTQDKRMGAFIINAFDHIHESGRDMTAEEKADYVDSFETR